jgi:hypothetical protein
MQKSDQEKFNDEAALQLPVKEFNEYVDRKLTQTYLDLEDDEDFEFVLGKETKELMAAYISAHEEIRSSPFIFPPDGWYAMDSQLYEGASTVEKLRFSIGYRDRSPEWQFVELVPEDGGWKNWYEMWNAPMSQLVETLHVKYPGKYNRPEYINARVIKIDVGLIRAYDGSNPEGPISFDVADDSQSLYKFLKEKTKDYPLRFFSKITLVTDDTGDLVSLWP